MTDLEERNRVLAALMIQLIKALEALAEGEPQESGPGILQLVLAAEQQQEDIVMTMLIVGQSDSSASADISSITSKEVNEPIQQGGIGVPVGSAAPSGAGVPGAGGSIVPCGGGVPCVSKGGPSGGGGGGFNIVTEIAGTSISPKVSTDVMEELAALKGILVEHMNVITTLCKKMSMLEQHVTALQTQAGDKMLEMEHVRGEIDYLKEEKDQMEEFSNTTGDDQTMETVKKLLMDQNKVIKKLHQQKADIKQQIYDLNQELDRKCAELDEARNELKCILKEHEAVCKQMAIEDEAVGKESTRPSRAQMMPRVDQKTKKAQAQPSHPQMDMEKFVTVMSQIQTVSVMMMMTEQKQNLDADSDEYFDAIDCDDSAKDEVDQFEDVEEGEIFEDADECRDKDMCDCGSEICPVDQCLCEDDVAYEESYATAECPDTPEPCLCPPPSKLRPLPPDNLRIISRIGKDSLLIGWDISADQSVIGYEVHIDGELNSRVRSANRDRTMLWPLNLREPLQISMYSYNERGFISCPLELIVNPISE